MKDIRFYEDLNCKITKPSYISVIRNKNFIFPYKNGKPFFSFIFVQRGRLSCRFIRSDEKLTIEKNELLYVPKSYPYVTEYMEDNTKIQLLNFDVENGDSLKNLCTPNVIKSPDIVWIFNSISLQNMQSPLFLSAKIFELLFLNETQYSVPKKYDKIMPAVKEMNEYYFKNEKISYYARLCNMSEQNFRKLFKEFTSKSSIEYRNLIRIKNVRRFLASGEFTVAEAAYLAGFNNMAFFHETYRKYNQDAPLR